jgi:hypothetical protein
VQQFCVSHPLALGLKFGQTPLGVSNILLLDLSHILGLNYSIDGCRLALFMFWLARCETLRSSK